jgi:hypothetical protein
MPTKTEWLAILCTVVAAVSFVFLVRSHTPDNLVHVEPTTTTLEAAHVPTTYRPPANP